MISDVLWEARAELLRYLQEFPDNYQGLEPEILDLCERMESLRRYLDNPFPTERHWTKKQGTPQCP